MEEKKEPEKSPWYKTGILSYKDSGSQTVLKLFGFELTAPAGLKNPGTVYLSFIFINILIFFVLKSFIAK